MGLDLQVGILADLARHDPEGAARFQEQLDRVNRALAAAGLPPHREPVDLPDDRVWSCSMGSYSSLHALRRVAAHLSLRQELPPPQPRGAPDDPIAERYHQAVLGRPGLLDRLLRRAAPAPLPFQHLMLHSDAEGFYLPADFPEVVFPDPSLGVAGAMIGSVPRLRADCVRLAGALGLPPDVDPEDDDLLEAFEAQDPSADGWRRYAVEAHSCAGLLRACDASLATGAAIVFC